MSGLSKAALKFLDGYQSRRGEMEASARLAREIIEDIVKETGALVHVVSARAKTIESIRGKCRRKRYKRPKSQMTDLIGVRIITYYRDQVDPIVRTLQDKLEINSKKSVDKRLDLGLRDFGYSSVHLIAKIRPTSIDSAAHRELRTHWFEVQVRSILEHAWAEIEHEVVYKSGIRQPNDVLRRFAALAGSLELLDKEFLALRKERETLIDKYSKLFRDKRDWSIAFDVARLLGFLGEYRRRKRWSSLQLDQEHFGPTFESACVESLKAAGLGTPASLWGLLHSRSYRRKLSSFAALKGLAPDQVSPLASIVIAVVTKRPRLLSVHFPEILFDPALTEIISTRQRRFTN